MPVGKDTERIVTYLSKEDKILLEQYAAKEHRSMSNMVLKIVTDYIRSQSDQRSK